MIIFYILNILACFLNILGFRGIYYIAIALSILSFDILGIRKNIILSNLDIVFGNSKTLAEKKSIARKSMASFFATTLEFIASKYLFNKAKINLISPENIINALKQGKGMYAMCIHMSNWELLCSVNSKLFNKINVVVKPISKGNVAKWIEKIRTEIGFNLIDRSSQIPATKKILKSIKNKEIIGFIVDQKRPKGENLPFFKKMLLLTIV